jgi:hypothetical protein
VTEMRCYEAPALVVLGSFGANTLGYGYGDVYDEWDGGFWDSDDDDS